MIAGTLMSAKNESKRSMSVSIGLFEVVANTRRRRSWSSKEKERREKGEERRGERGQLWDG